jgi:hypothetical protein
MKHGRAGYRKSFLPHSNQWLHCFVPFFLAFTSKYLQLLFDGEMTAASRVHQHTLPENVRGVSPLQGIALWNCIIIHWFFGQSSCYQQDHEPASKYT